VKLLLDENLSRRLIPFLQHAFPGTDHVVHQGLESASDREVWDRARREDFVIVTRDADFGEMSLLLGQPPQVIRLRTGNLTRPATLKLLLDQRAVIEQALVEEGAAVVELWS
jgi:predicted nuclease of predicted toxin-antitoxin system